MRHTKESLIEKIATNEYEIEYIKDLSNEVFDLVADVIEFNDQHETVSFKDIQTHAMMVSVMRYDFITREKLKKLFPNEEYEYLHLKEMSNEWEIYRAVNDDTSMIIVMADQHFYTMDRVGTILGLSHYVKYNNVAGWITVVDLNGREMSGFPAYPKHAQAN